MRTFVSVLSRLLVLMVAVVLSSCSSSPTAATTASPPMTSVFVGHDNQSVTLSRPGQTYQFTAYAGSVNSSSPVTSGVTWQSSNPAVATVAGGLVTAVAGGTATISATYAGQTGTTDITVALGNTMTASVDGTTFTAVVSVMKTGSFQLYLVGTDPRFSLGMAVYLPSGVGTFDLQEDAEADFASLADTAAPGVSWATDATGGGGTLTVSTLTSTSASGTFSLTLAPAQGMPPSTRVVTNGVFNVVF